jgi:predicted site-specific integrase-resolvase
MVALLIGYARVSTDQQDLTAQRDGLTALGVADSRVYVDQGLTGTNRKRPGLREAWALTAKVTRWWSQTRPACAVVARC